MIGGYLGLMLAGSLGAWAVSTINDNPDNDRTDRNRVAAPTDWVRPDIVANIDLPGRPMSISSDGNDLWVGLFSGTLIRIDAETNEILQEIDVGEHIIEVAASHGKVWVAASPEGTEMPMVGGYYVERIYEVDSASSHVDTAVELRSPSSVRMAAGDGQLFYLDELDEGQAGSVFRYDAGSGEITDLNLSATSLALVDNILWLGGGYEVRKVNATTGELLGTTDASDRERNLQGLCGDCGPPPRAVAANRSYVTHVPENYGLLNVLDGTGEFLYQTHVSVTDASLAIDGNTLFLSLSAGRLGIFNLSAGEMEHEVSDLDVGYSLPMTVAADSVWVLNGEKKTLTRVSDLGPAPEPSFDLGDGRCCEEATPETYIFDELGFTVTYPSDWFRAEEPMTKLVNPREILTLGTMPMSISDEELGDCAPTEPLSRLGPDGALIFVTEREDLEPAPYDFDEWPSDLGLDDLRGPVLIECWDRETYLGYFRASGRAIYISVALGDNAGTERRQEVSDILGSLRFDPLPGEDLNTEELEAFKGTITKGGPSGDESAEVDFMSEGPAPRFVKECEEETSNMSDLHCRAVIAMANGELHYGVAYSDEELRELLGN